MVKIKKSNKLIKLLIFTYLVVFPFGQLFRIEHILVTDIIVGIITAIYIYNTRFNVLKYLFGHFYPFIFSLFFSLIFFKIPDLFTGFLYLIRLIVYILLAFQINDLVKDEPKIKKVFLWSIVILGFYLSIFGWLQYYYFFDLRFLKVFGWDDHLGRLVSTILDPAFTGILLVISSLTTLFLLEKRKTFLLVMIEILLVLTLAFTYSRSSYLAFLLGVGLFIMLTKNLKYLLFVCFFLFIVWLLPRPSSEGVKLERTASVYSKFDNYIESLKLVKVSPLFGLGFNNICVAKNKFISPSPPNSHSCGSFDNSLLFLLSTAGIIGCLSLLYTTIGLLKKINHKLKVLVYPVLLAVLIHSFFTNTLFYPWVMGFLAIIIGVSITAFKRTTD